MFLTVSCRFVPLLDTGLSAGVAIATPASKISPHLRLPLRTSPAWTVCCWITLISSKKSYPFGTREYKTLI